MRMKFVVCAVLLMSLLPAFAQQSKPAKEVDTATISSSATTANFSDGIGAQSNEWEFVVTGTPTTLSIVTQGCMRGGTCYTLDTYTGTANAVRPTAGGYDSYKVTPTWTGGSSPTVTINRTGTLGPLVTAFPATYTCGMQNITAAATPTDIITLTGSATMTVRVTRIVFYATQTTGGVATVQLIRRSTADTAGTFVQDGMNPYDLFNAASTVTCGHYTVNPTLGNANGTLANWRPYISTATQSPTGYVWEDFGDGTQPITLRGVNDILVVNLGGATLTGLSYTAQIEWTETQP